MKLAVLGGSGGIDQHFINHTLRSGYALHLLAPNAPVLNHPNLILITGTAEDTYLLEATLKDAHAVICLPQAINNIDTLQAVLQTMFAYGTRRLILVADLQQTIARHFEVLLKKTDIDWTIIQYTPAHTSKAFSVQQTDLAKYIAQQITDVTNLRSALLLSN